ncbi:MAG TPA: hypothetical protein VF337_02415 [Candidatus Limnocylindrales bacterium]
MTGRTLGDHPTRRLAVDSIALANRYAEAAARPGTASEDLAHLAGEMLSAIHGPSDPAVPAILDTLAPIIATATPEVMSLTSTMVGLLCERGADPGPAAEPFVGRFNTTVLSAYNLFGAIAARVAMRSADGSTARTTDGERDIYAEEDAARIELASEMPEPAAAWDLLTALLPASTAIFGRSQTARRAAQPSLGRLQAMRQSHQAAGWLCEILRVLENERFVAIEPATGRGIRGHFGGLADNFQLNVLIMNAFPRDADQPARVSQSAVDVALSHGPQETDETITGSWNLYEWPALGRDGSLPPVHGQLGTTHWIWNEGVPADIPPFGGERVIVLGPPTYTRTWRSQRAFAFLQGSLTVDRTLTPEEVQLLILDIIATPRVG